MAGGTPNFEDLAVDSIDALVAAGWKHAGVTRAGFWTVTQLTRAKSSVEIWTPAGVKQDRVWLSTVKGGKSAERGAINVLEAAGIAPAERRAKGLRLARTTRRDRAKKNPHRARRNFPADQHRQIADELNAQRRELKMIAHQAAVAGDRRALEDIHELNMRLAGRVEGHEESSFLGGELFAHQGGFDRLLQEAKKKTQMYRESWLNAEKNSPTRAYKARRNPGATLASASTRRPPALNPPGHYERLMERGESWFDSSDGRYLATLAPHHVSPTGWVVIKINPRLNDGDPFASRMFPLSREDAATEGARYLNAFEKARRQDLLARDFLRKRGAPTSNPPLLPLTSSRRKWDATKARRALKKWATKNGRVDMKKYARGFLAHDGKPENLTSWKLPIAMPVKSKAGRVQLKAVPHAISAAAGVIDGARGGVDLPYGQRQKATAQLARYYKKMNRTPPWRK